MKIAEFSIIDSIWIKYLKALAIFINPGDFKPQKDMWVTIVGPNGRNFTTKILGVERYARAIDYPSDHVGLLLHGFTEYIDMKDWRVVFNYGN